MLPKGRSAADAVEVAVRAQVAVAGGGWLIIGICGAQGSGKSTLCRTVAARLEADGLRVAVLSIDDLYLPRAERERLARNVHPLFRTRGVPGTHDPALGRSILRALGAPGVTRVPRFDKAANDRRPESEWDSVVGPVDIVLFEGWCVGARAEGADALREPVNALEALEDRDGLWRTAANAALASDYADLFDTIDFLILLEAPGFEVVRQWRGQQEAELRSRAGGDAGGIMDAAAVDRFVGFYERLTRHILREMPERADMVIRLDEHRGVTSVFTR